MRFSKHGGFEFLECGSLLLQVGARVAVQLLMDIYRFESGDVANNEEELHLLVARRLKEK